VDGIGEHHIKQSLSGSEGQKSHVLPHLGIINLKQMQRYYWTWLHTKRKMCMGGIGKGKETKNLDVVDVLTVEEQIQ
jgi:hypothetical protein